MRLVESETVRRYDVLAFLVTAAHVLRNEERYREDQIRDARERIAFWGALAAAGQPPEENDQDTV